MVAAECAEIALAQTHLQIFFDRFQAVVYADRLFSGVPADYTVLTRVPFRRKETACRVGPELVISGVAG